MRLLREAAAACYAAAAAAVLVAPSLVLAGVARRGGIAPSLQASDITLVSAAVGIGYALLAWRRLRRQEDETHAEASVWIAAINGLVVLSLMASSLVILVFHELGPLAAPLAGQEWTLLLLWAGVLVAAVVIAEAVERSVFQWLIAGG